MSAVDANQPSLVSSMSLIDTLAGKTSTAVIALDVLSLRVLSTPLADHCSSTELERLFELREATRAEYGVELSKPVAPDVSVDGASGRMPAAVMNAALALGREESGLIEIVRSEARTACRDAGLIDKIIFVSDGSLPSVSTSYALGIHDALVTLRLVDPRTEVLGLGGRGRRSLWEGFDIAARFATRSPSRRVLLLACVVSDAPVCRNDVTIISIILSSAPDFGSTLRIPPCDSLLLTTRLQSDKLRIYLCSGEGLEETIATLELVRRSDGDLIHALCNVARAAKKH